MCTLASRVPNRAISILVCIVSPRIPIIVAWQPTNLGSDWCAVELKRPAQVANDALCSDMLSSGELSIQLSSRRWSTASASVASGARQFEYLRFMGIDCAGSTSGVGRRSVIGSSLKTAGRDSGGVPLLGSDGGGDAPLSSITARLSGVQTARLLLTGLLLAGRRCPWPEWLLL